MGGAARGAAGAIAGDAGQGAAIDLGADPSLVNELRAPGASLAALGLIVFAGFFRPRLAPLSAMLAVTVFLAYAFGRMVSVVADGMPAPGLVEAIFIELAVGGLCLAVFWRALTSGPSGERRSALPVE